MSDYMFTIGVKDRMTGEIVFTHSSASYYIAHKKAERWCKKHLGERGTIVEVSKEEWK